MGQIIPALLFQPPPPSYGKDKKLLWLKTARKDVIPAWYLERVPASEGGITLLFSHGNAEDIGMAVQYFREVCGILNCNIFCYEYAGYGQSTGVPSEESLYACIEAAYKYLTDIIGIPWDKVVLYGRSLGSGPSCHLASIAGVRGLIIQSGLLSALRVGFNLRFTHDGDMFPNCDIADRIVCPTYIIHGTHDEIVPFYHGRQLFSLVAQPYEPFWVEGGGHNNLEYVAREAFYERLNRFLRYLDQTPPTQAETDHARNSPL